MKPIRRIAMRVLFAALLLGLPGAVVVAAEGPSAMTPTVSVPSDEHPSFRRMMLNLLYDVLLTATQSACTQSPLRGAA